MEDVTDEEKVRGKGDGIYAERCQLIAEAQPEEEVQQHDVQAIVEQVGTTEADTVLGRSLLLESPVGTEPVVYNKTEHIADGIGHVHIDPVLQHPVDGIMNGG